MNAIFDWFSSPQLAALLTNMLEQGFLFSFLGLGVLISFRFFRFPDLTAEGSYPFGGAVVATLLVAHLNPFLATAIAAGAGALAGIATALIHTKFKINNIISGIIVMTAIYSINLRVMGRANTPLLDTASVYGDTVGWLTRFGLAVQPGSVTNIALLLVVLVFVSLALVAFLKTDLGLAVRATGENEGMIRSLGVNTDNTKILGLAISNAIIALSGALVAQNHGFADIGMGIGVLVTGAAAVLIGETVFGDHSVERWVFAVLVGAVVYRLLVALALRAEREPQVHRLRKAERDERGARLVVREPALHHVRRLAHRQLAERDERGFLEEVLEGRLCPVAGIDDTTSQPVEESARREIDHDHFVGLLDHPVRDRLPHPHAGALPDLIVEALEVLDVHRRQNVDPGVQQFVHVLPPLDPARPWSVRVRELVHDCDVRPPREDRRRVHLFEPDAAVLDDSARDRLEPFDQRDRVGAPMRLEVPNHDINALGLQLVSLDQHLVGLAHTGGIAQEDLEPTAMGRRCTHLVAYCGKTRRSMPSAARINRSSGARRNSALHHVRRVRVCPTKTCVMPWFLA